MKKRTVRAFVEWASVNDGGRRSPVYPGYRPMIRFIAHIEEFEKIGRDVVIVECNNINSRQGNILMQFVADSAPDELLKLKEEFELLEGGRVVGKGKIEAIVNDEK